MTFSRHYLYPFEIHAGAWILNADVEDDGDCQKMTYDAVNSATGQRVCIDHSPYDKMTFDAFTAHIEKGFPRRVGPGAWTCDTIINHEAAA